MAYVSRVYVGGKLVSSGKVSGAFDKPRMNGAECDRAHYSIRELQRPAAAEKALSGDHPDALLDDDEA
ncbi:hypothetical protein WJ542_04030 [Paraburkholderia sp. B3]|uniref:hypothetical protein n=1 Tax=Paraburkholderia sp. B3 TaxID=3134791 RepID=UPI003982256F